MLAILNFTYILALKYILNMPFIFQVKRLNKGLDLKLYPKIMNNIRNRRHIFASKIRRI